MHASPGCVATRDEPIQVGLADLSAADVSAFVLDQCAKRGTADAHNVISALRAFLRFLYVEGWTQRDLTSAVLKLARRRRELPRGFDFVIDGERHHHADPVNVGEMQVWDVVNATQIDHPFHLHGFFFQVLEINGKKPAWRSLEDVINVPPKATVRIAWHPDDRPGMWMYHCHILEHHAGGTSMSSKCDSPSGVANVRGYFTAHVRG